ncbi:kinase-like domain-containing protein [Abortiporus biennis]|nr:kinase-like domain-containing protein [Abortiporus biennis]
MLDDTEEFSSSSAMVALAPLDPEWQPILHASNQVVLYNPTSHAVTIQRRSPPLENATVIRRPTPTNGRCPFCHRRMSDGEGEHENMEDELDDDLGASHPRSRVANYFQLLQVANETASVPPTPRSESPVLDLPAASGSSGGQDAFNPNNMAEGYFKAFFQEEGRLGMGANGSVYLCRHVLDGNSLGHFALKKIAIGQSHSYLVNTLREVRLLEKLHHPNIVTYHHSWLETCQFSSFGPKVPTLHVLMQWAEGGSLDDFIDARQGHPSASQVAHIHPTSGSAPGPSNENSHAEETLDSSTPISRGARIRAFRALQRAAPEERERLRREMAINANGVRSGHRNGNWKAVHLLSAEEVKSLFSDVVEGLAFLHDHSILHLDLKPGNVLLTWDGGRLIPRAMLSDFGTSQDMLNSRTRSGNTGTLEYTSPESLPSPTTGLLQQIDSKSDMWSLGMILHKLLFFRLPYRHASDNVEKSSRTDGKEVADLLEKEVLTYPGFKPVPAMNSTFESRRIPRAFLFLLEGLLNVNPGLRPSSERVLGAIREGKLDPIVRSSNSRSNIPTNSSLVPILRKPSPELHRNIEHSSEGQISEPRIEKVDEAVGTDDTRMTAQENMPPFGLRALPSANDSEVLFASEISSIASQLHVTPVLFRRTVKAVILAAKVMSLSMVCTDSRFHIIIRTLALCLAVMDNWFDSFRISFLLGLAHVMLVKLAC